MEVCSLCGGEMAHPYYWLRRRVCKDCFKVIHAQQSPNGGRDIANAVLLIVVSAVLGGVAACWIGG